MALDATTSSPQYAAMGPSMNWIIRFAIVAAVLYVLLVAALYFAQHRILYVPDRTRVDPDALGLEGVAERLLETPDGETLVTWRLAPRPGRPTILYFPGNAGNLAARAERVRAFAGKGFGLLMLAYRGYAGSTGRPSEERLYADALLAYETLRKEGTAPSDIVVYGESLGTGVAVELATRRKVAALILDAPFTSIVDVAQRSYPFVWVRPFVTERYNSLEKIARVGAPLLILHGARDPLIPPAMPEALLARAREPKRLVSFSEGHHSDLFEHGAIEAIAAFLDEIASGGA